MNEFYEHWIELGTGIDGKNLVHLVLLELSFRRGCGLAAVDLIKHNIIVYQQFPPN